jgi:SAM-dependent methyltransferase
MQKDAVRAYWERESCGEVYAHGESRREELAQQARTRYELEPYLPAFARFEEGAGARVLEVGVGMGADHLEWARHSPALLAGVDLTPRALGHTHDRFALEGLHARLACADAEHLPFRTDAFDLVFSWGVLHHTPDTRAAIAEVHRVLRRGGRARVMLYHSRSITVDLLWMRYGLARGRPWRSRQSIVAEHLESPGTQAFTVDEARDLFAAFSRVQVRPQLAFSDLLLGAAGQRHGGVALRLARRVWPRRLIRAAAPSRGFNLLVEAEK